MYNRFFPGSFRKSAMIGNSRRRTGLLWTCAVVASSFGYAQTKSIVDDVPTMPVITATDPKHAEVELKLDTSKKEFTADNGLFFATLSKIAYLPKKDAAASILGNSTMKGMGFDQFYWYEADEELARAHYFDEMDDTEGFVAANDEAVVVVFRGTKEAIDWSTNVRVLGRRVPETWCPNHTMSAELHGGFDDGLNTVWVRQGMLDVVRKLYHKEGAGGKKRKLYLAGHSLGGALATVAAAHLLFSENMQISGMYTIGSPRVFNHGMAKIFDEKISDGSPMKDKYFRCRNNNDIVTRIPPGYAHVGTEVYFDRLGTLSEGTSLLDRILGRVNALVRGEVVDGVHDHSSNEYLRLFKQAVSRAKLSVLDKTKGIAIDVARKVVPGEESEARKEEIEAAKAAAVEMSKEL